MGKQMCHPSPTGNLETKLNAIGQQAFVMTASCMTSVWHMGAGDGHSMVCRRNFTAASPQPPPTIPHLVLTL